MTDYSKWCLVVLTLIAILRSKPGMRAEKILYMVGAVGFALLHIDVVLEWSLGLVSAYCLLRFCESRFNLC